MWAGKCFIWGGVMIGAAVFATAGCGSSTSGGANSAGGAGHAGMSGAAGASISGAGGVSGASAHSGGAGGSAGMGSGGANAGASGSGGLGLVLGDSKTEACIAYAVASCVRVNECGGAATDDCLRNSFGCPDAVFSAGSTRTVAGLKACATELLAFSCDKLNNGEFPACVTAGTRQPNEPCAYGSQCASLECSHNATSGCNTCVKELQLGEDCSAPNTACAPPLSCNAGQCAPSANQSPRRGIGEDCSGDGVLCVFHSFCSVTTHLCVAIPTLGMSCAEAKACTDGYCPDSTQLCTADPGLNQPCGVSGGTANDCAPGFVCSTIAQPSGTCIPAPLAGQPCYDGSVSTFNGTCDAAAWCDYRQTPQTCALLGAPGASCEATSQCQSGMFCSCADGTQSCTDETCNYVHLGGEACGAPNVTCHPGFSCTNGKCQPRDAQYPNNSCENP